MIFVPTSTCSRIIFSRTSRVRRPPGHSTRKISFVSLKRLCQNKYDNRRDPCIPTDASKYPSSSMAVTFSLIVLPLTWLNIKYLKKNIPKLLTEETFVNLDGATYTTDFLVTILRQHVTSNDIADEKLQIIGRVETKKRVLLVYKLH